MIKIVNKNLTPRQKKVLDFIVSFSKSKGYAPSLEEIASHFKLRAISTVHQYVKTLVAKGYLKKEENQPRGMLPIVRDTETIRVPIIGNIAAGEPIEVIEYQGDTVTITRDKLGKIGNFYALRVQGNSMIDEGIFDGDIVVVRQQQTVDNGQTVVAILNENEATLKKFYREKNKIRLQPANPTLFPIFTNDVEIRGVVVKIIRNLNFQTSKESDGKYKRKIDYSWDYRGEFTKPFTHCFHTYPAMFIPQIARRLIETYSAKGETICDIFCGSGTALVESRLLGRNAYGIDLNPLAIFLAKVKTTEVAPRVITRQYFRLIDMISRINGRDVEVPEFLNINFWYKPEAIIELAKIKKAIKELKEEKIRNFFMVAFSEAARLSSNMKNGEFKLVRIRPEKLISYNPSVIGIFKKKVEANINGMSDFYKNVVGDNWAKPIYGDSSMENGIANDSIDCIVTSPPYGDSRTTVAYGQFSRLSAQWIDIFEEPDKASGVDKELLGGKPSKSLEHDLRSLYLAQTINQISGRDKNRARDVLSFYIGLERCLKQAHRILKINRHFCIVIGNRLVKQIRIPTDLIIAELSENIGFVCEDIIVRNIPGKRMPSKNSPTNIAGVLEETMTKESIVILRKV